MDSELHRFISLSSAVAASLCYSYYIVPLLPKGLTRLIFLLPVISLFTLIPLSFHTFRLRGPAALFLLWLGNFKLLLFAFDLGPLSTSHSLSNFLATASFPVNVRLATKPTSPPQPLLISSALFLAKLFLYCSVIYLSLHYRKNLNQNLRLLLYCFYIYLSTEIFLVISIVPVRALLGSQFELDPQFNEPFLSTSLQDFWGRRWNLVVNATLRLSVYDPVRRALVSALGGKTASFLATVATFAVSGLMHELIWFYFTLVSPTWEVTCFFVLQGVCTAAETAAKRALSGRVKLPAAVSTPLTLGFVALTAKWLFFPQLLRNGVDDWSIGEYAPLVEFVKRTIS